VRKELLMFKFFCLFFAILFQLVLASPFANAGTTERFSEPSKIAEELTGVLAVGDAKLLAQRIVTIMGVQDQKASLEGAFGYIAGKKADYSEVVYDKWYGTSLRRIVSIASYSDLTFLYVRYTFKRTRDGWVLVNYDFKTETQDLFPQGYAP
jgi:hypothetical protein